MNSIRTLFLVLTLLVSTLIAPVACLGVPIHTLPQGRLEKVIDGDTVRMRYLEKSELVRMIGIDAPERSSNKKALRDASQSGQSLESIFKLGEQSRAYLAAIITPGMMLHVETDIVRRDKYGRLLAYLYTSSGELLNARMVWAGYAQPMTVPPNLRYMKELRRANEDARNHHRGLWKDSDGLQRP